VSNTSNDKESFRPGVSIQVRRRAARTVPTTNPRRASVRARVRLRKASAGIRQVFRQLRLRAGESADNAVGVEAFSSANCPVSSEAGQKGESTAYDGGLLRRTCRNPRSCRKDEILRGRIRKVRSVRRTSLFGVRYELHKSEQPTDTFGCRKGAHETVRGRAVYVVCPYGIDEPDVFARACPVF
jgi:hypothetical protein